MSTVTTPLATETDPGAGNGHRPLRTVAGIPTTHAAEMIEWLDQRVVATIDLSLTLKHVHWNVTGPNFIAVHEMLDTFTDFARAAVDELAERIRTLGGVPNGLPGYVVQQRWWTDYPLAEGPAEVHLRLLDDVYESVILDHHRAIAHAANLDPVSEGMLVDQTAQLEQHQWFVRSFLRGPQPDADESRFGASDRAASSDEAEAAARAEPLHPNVADRFREMADIGAEVQGEGQI